MSKTESLQSPKQHVIIYIQASILPKDNTNTDKGEIHTMKRRILLLAVCAAMLLSGCTGGESQASESSTAEAKPSAETARETTPLDALHSLSFDGCSFRVMYNHMFDKGVYDIYMMAEEMNGDILNDTIYERNLAVEELFQIQLEFLPHTEGSDSMISDATKTIMAGMDAFDMIQFASTWDNTISMIQQKALYNLLDIPHMHLEASYFYGDLTEKFIINNQLYFGFSQYNNAGILPLYMVFNKNMMQDLGLEYPYKQILDGSWTWDCFQEYIKGTAIDLDGNGIMDERDQYGYLNSSGLTNYLVWGFDVDVTQRQENGSYIPNLHNEKLVSAIQRIVDFQAYHEDILITSNNTENARHYFMEGLSMFSTTGTGAMVLREIEDFDFGIAPYPKYDETQQKYSCYLYPNQFGVPATMQNTEMTGAVLEAFAYLSEQLLKPAYLEVYHENKILRDAESAEVALLLMDSTCMDITRYYDFADGKITPVYMLSSIKDPSAVVSTLASVEAGAMKQADEFFSIFFEE